VKKELFKRPLVTEKIMANNQYAFAVDVKANKKDIIKAFKEVFNVDVVSISTVIVKGKSTKSWKTRTNTPVAPWKKAIVKLKKDQKIDMFEVSSEKK
jgi:ribosomal protein L23